MIKLPRGYCEDGYCQYNRDCHCGIKDGKYPEDANCFEERRALMDENYFWKRQAELERALEQGAEWDRKRRENSNGY